MGVGGRGGGGGGRGGRGGGRHMSVLIRVSAGFFPNSWLGPGTSLSLSFTSDTRHFLWKATHFLKNACRLWFRIL